MPGAATSVTLVTWFGSMPAGSLKGSVLACDDLEKTLQELAERGVRCVQSQGGGGTPGRSLGEIILVLDVLG